MPKTKKGRGHGRYRPSRSQDFEAGHPREVLVAEALIRNGYLNVRTLKDEVHNHRFADLVAAPVTLAWPTVGGKNRNHRPAPSGIPLLFAYFENPATFEAADGALRDGPI